MGQIPGALHNLEAESHRRQETKKRKNVKGARTAERSFGYLEAVSDFAGAASRNRNWLAGS